MTRGRAARTLAAALEFIESNRERPFYLHYATTLLHGPAGNAARRIREAVIARTRLTPEQLSNGGWVVVSSEELDDPARVGTRRVDPLTFAAAHPSDDEAQVFYALALLSTMPRGDSAMSFSTGIRPRASKSGTWLLTWRMASAQRPLCWKMFVRNRPAPGS